MPSARFTTTAATIIGTTKAPVKTAAGVKGYATPLTWGLSETQGADIASVAGVTDIGAATGPYIHITGVEAITGLGTCTAGQRRTVKFTGACTLTHNGTSLILPGSANITTAANDAAEFVSLGSGNWLCLWFKRASGKVLGAALASDAQARALSATDVALTPANLAARGAFFATLGGSDQTSVDNAGNPAKVTFNTEVFDVGSYFDTTNNRWTPPAGKVRVSAAVTVSTAPNGACNLYIYKNGSLLVGSGKTLPTATFSGLAPVSCVADANGTDYFEVYVALNAAGAITLYGNATLTYFCGEQI